MEVAAGLTGAAAGLTIALLTMAGFWMALGSRIQKAESGAEAALQTAAEAENELKELRTQHSALSSHFALYREQSIEKFVSHATIGALEKRLVDALDGVNQRLDRLLEAGIRANR